MPTPQELQAIRMGLDNVVDPVEKRNLRFAEARRIFDDPTTPPELKKVMQDTMAEENPNPGRNLLQGLAYGVGEGLTTPWAMRKVGLTDPGVPTGWHTGARIAGNIAGAVGGLGYALPKLAVKTALNLGPKAIAGIYGMYGAGQGVGGHDEAEQQKAGQRDFMIGAEREVPSYMQPSAATSVPGMMNITGQALFSALSGGSGAASLLKPGVKSAFSRISPGKAGVMEAIGSGGLMLNDAMGGPSGLIEATKDNPWGMAQTAGMIGGMAGASAAVPWWAGRHQTKGAQALDNAPDPHIPTEMSWEDPTPMTPTDRSWENLRGIISPEMLDALQLDSMRQIAERSVDEADRKMRKGVLDQKNGVFIAEDPKSGKAFQVMHQYHPETMDAIGRDPLRSGTWTLQEIGNEQNTITASTDFVGNNLSLHWQPAGGGKAVRLPPGQIPRTSEQKAILHTSSGDRDVIIISRGSTKGTDTTQGSNETSLVLLDGELKLVKNSHLATPPVSEEAKAVQTSQGGPRMGVSRSLPRKEEFPSVVEYLQNRYGIKRADMASHQVGKQPDSAPPVAEPWDSPPTLPFDFDDILRAREWDLSKSTPARPRK